MNVTLNTADGNQVCTQTRALRAERAMHDPFNFPNQQRQPLPRPQVRCTNTATRD